MTQQNVVITLMQELNALLTKGEEQTQFAIQFIKEHLKCYPDSKRETLVKGLGPVGSLRNEKTKPTVQCTSTVCTLCCQKLSNIVTLQSSAKNSEHYNILNSLTTFDYLFLYFSSI